MAECNGTPFTTEKISASGEARTGDCYIIRPALNPLSYQVSRPRGYKNFFMLNSVEHEILNAHKISRKLAYIRLK